VLPTVRSKARYDCPDLLKSFKHNGLCYAGNAKVCSRISWC
jgi:hypothetical protein